jgi:LacI family gluconate utilization system Gnt-I transcriptional repressor
MWPALTTVRTPRVQIGESAATMLLQLMRGQAVPQPSVDLGWQLVQRQSS